VIANRQTHYVSKLILTWPSSNCSGATRGNSECSRRPELCWFFRTGYAY